MTGLMIGVIVFGVVLSFIVALVVYQESRLTDGQRYYLKQIKEEAKQAREQGKR